MTGDWALREDDLELAAALLRATADGDLALLQPPHFMAEVAAVLPRLMPQGALQAIKDLADLDIAWAEPT